MTAGINEDLETKLRALLASAMNDAPEYRSVSVTDDDGAAEPVIEVRTDDGEYVVEISVQHV